MNWKNVLNIKITVLHSHFSIMSTCLYKPKVSKEEKEGKGHWKLNIFHIWDFFTVKCAAKD